MVDNRIIPENRTSLPSGKKELTFRQFLQIAEQSPMSTGQAPNKPANVTMTKATKPSEFGGGGPTKDSPRQPTARPPGAGNYDYPVPPRVPGQIPVTQGMPKVVPSEFGSGGPTPNTPKVPPPPVPKQAMKKKMKKMKKK